MDEIEFLEKHKGEWFSSEEIAKKTGIRRGNITHKLKKLFESRAGRNLWGIKRKQVRERGKPYKYLWSIEKTKKYK